MDFSKFTDQQLITASKIRKYAIEAGIDPDYALSHALAENASLDNKIVGPKIEGRAERAVGIMQILPSTATHLKIDPTNEDENIRGGIDYLKQNLQTFNNDKFLASAAYHAGPATMKKFTETGDTSLLGPKTLTYLDQIRKMNNMESPGLIGDQEAQQTPPKTNEQTEELDVANLENLIDKNSGQKTPYGFSPKQDVLAGGAGALTGVIPTVVGGTLRAVGESFGEGLNKGMGSTTSTSSGSTNAVRNWIRSMGGQDRGAKDYKQAHEFETGTRKGATIRNPVTGERFTPTFRTSKPVLEAVEATEPVSALQRATSVGKSILSSPIVRRTVGPAAVAAGASETLERARAGDTLGTGLAGLSTLGSGAAMVPGLQVPGTAVSLGSLGALGLADSVRNRMAADAQNPPAPPTQEELQKAQEPAITYPQFKMKRKSPDEITGALEQSLDKQMQDFSAQPAQA
jgi:hypothetical protein